MVTAEKSKDAYQKAFQSFFDMDKANHRRCEYDRSIWLSCTDCEEIKQPLNPKFYIYIPHLSQKAK